MKNFPITTKAVELTTLVEEAGKALTYFRGLLGDYAWNDGSDTAVGTVEFDDKLVDGDVLVIEAALALDHADDDLRQPLALLFRCVLIAGSDSMEQEVRLQSSSSEEIITEFKKALAEIRELVKKHESK